MPKPVILTTLRPELVEAFLERSEIDRANVWVVSAGHHLGLLQVGPDVYALHADKGAAAALASKLGGRVLDIAGLQAAAAGVG
jgi:hypothetical protein